jgi:hypothetical protein
MLVTGARMAGVSARQTGPAWPVFAVDSLYFQQTAVPLVPARYRVGAARTPVFSLYYQVEQASCGAEPQRGLQP